MFRLRSFLCVFCFITLISLLPVQACTEGSGTLLLSSLISPQENTPLNFKALQTSSNFSAHLPLSLLQASVQNSPKNGEVVLQKLGFDPAEKHYLLQMTLVQWPIWDQVHFIIDFPSSTTIRLQLQNNWLPTDLVMSRLEEKLKNTLSLMPFELQRQDNQLQLAFQNGVLHLPPGLSAEHVGLNAQLLPTGDFSLTLSAETERLPLEKHTPQSANQARLDAHTCIDSLDTLQGDMQLNMTMALTPEDVVGLGNKQLSAYLEAATGDVNFQGDFSGSLWPLQFNAQGTMLANFKQMQVEGTTYQDIQSVPFNWSYQNPDRLKIYPELKHQHNPAHFSNNHLELFIDGPKYFKELKKALREARESIDQETFSFYDGKTTREVARLMLLKAMGLREQRTGDLEVDLFAPNGARVYLMHNHKYSQIGAEKVAQIFAQAEQDIFTELQSADQPLALYQKRLKQHFKIAYLTQGVIKTDHRKMLVIDGQTAYVGGLNMADHYLTDDGFHDLMIRVQGPAVREMHDEFIENWQQISPATSIHWNQKRANMLKTDVIGLKTSSIAVLTTDDDQPEMIETHLLELIASAQKVIRLEHAYIYYEPIEEALRAALKRGVRLEIVFSERNDESLFEMLNPATVYDLMTFAPNQVKVWLYQGKGSKNSYMSHTKYLSVDGLSAIVGSANLIPRSLHSLFWSQGKPLLFNEEMSLFIRDEQFVKRLDRELLEFDIRHFSRPASSSDLRQLIERRGGASQLLIERIKGLLS